MEETRVRGIRITTDCGEGGLDLAEVRQRRVNGEGLWKKHDSRQEQQQNLEREVCILLKSDRRE